MNRRRRKSSREKDMTDQLLAGDNVDEDRVEQRQRFSRRSAGAQQTNMEQTALLRAAEEELSGDIDALPLGEVVQVYSLFSDVEWNGTIHLCVLRKTLTKLADTSIVVGDRVRIRNTGIVDESGRPEAVIEQILPRRTILTRADSFKGIEQAPIVANADQMLIVASIREPKIKWGLIDRMIVACLGGSLQPILCINKVDVADATNLSEKPDEVLAREALAHYAQMNIPVVKTSVVLGTGLDALKDLLRDKTTVLAGHSGVGKSSLIRSIQPQLDIRIAALSGYTGKGRHTTTSARRYRLDFGGYVIDTPGVKLFGLWGITRENAKEFFPDVQGGTAPEWRKESYDRIVASVVEA